MVRPGTGQRLGAANAAIIMLCFLGLAAVPGNIRGQEPAPPAASPDVEAGRAVYERRCRNCHGAEGLGDGPAADFLRPRPRDFTRGLYKIRSTPSGQLPTDDDLFRAVSRGLPGTAMPAWDHVLSEKERRQAVQYIKTFAKRFGRQKSPPVPVALGKPPATSAESVAKGKQLFRELECWKCHGEDGRADGPSAPELRDDWDHPIRPANLTRPWNFRGGSAPEEIALRVTTGLAGTPMPSFADVLDHEKTWHLVNYVRSLSPTERPPLRTVIRARRMSEAVPAQPDDPRWDAVEAYAFPLVGQVIMEPRMFTPTVTEIAVQAVYDNRDVALRLVWDDPTHSTPQPAAADTPEVFEDVVAVQFPAQRTTGLKKPYFLMGNPGQPVTLWQWGTGTAQAVEQQATGLAQATAGPGRSVVASAVFRNGQYRVVVKRPLTTGDAERDVQFEPGRFIPIAFFVRDGANGETGTRMAISHWYNLLLEPPVPTVVYVAPSLAVVIAAAAEWWFIRRIKRKKEGHR